jgi:hypothetical protein
LKRDRRFTVLRGKQTPLTRFFDGCGDEELAKLKVLADQIKGALAPPRCWIKNLQADNKPRSLSVSIVFIGTPKCNLR